MTDSPLEADDLTLLARVTEGNDWLRALLCTLARRGTLLRQRQPERAAELLRTLSLWPWFKGGQFLFDLMEWEDFMVDGPPPPLLPDVLTPENWQRLDDLVAQLQALLQTASATGTEALAADGVQALLLEPDLPPLQPGLHLYRDVVLGVWASAVPLGRRPQVTVLE